MRGKIFWNVGILSSRTNKLAGLLIMAVVMACIPLRSRGQSIGSPPENNSTSQNYGDLSQYGNNPFQNDDDPDLVEYADTTAKPKIRKPLESYFFDDSIRIMHNFVWHVNTYINHIEMTRIDTALNELQINYPFQKRGVGDAYQGNLGGASVPLDYFDRPRYRDFNFAQSFDTYFFFPQNVNFYNVKKPFTHLSYYTAGQKKYAEEGFYLTHAQNISPSTGFNIDYKSRGTRGIYTNQRARDKNLSLAFSHTGKKYTVHAGYIYNAVINRENGGITDDKYITDTILELASNIPVRLRDARNTIKNNNFWLVQSYGFPLRKLTEDDFSIADGSTIFVGHAFEYSRWYKKYSDTRQNTIYNDIDDNQYEYYDKWYIHPTQTNDSINESLFANRVFVQLQPWDRDGIVGLIDAGAGMDVHHYYYFHTDQYLSGKAKGVDKTSYYVYGAVEGKFRRYFDWSGNIRLVPAGYRSGDLTVGANASISAFVRGNPVTLSGKFAYELRSADFWSENFFSNHYAWSNSFDKENETRIEVKLDIPAIAFELGAGQSVVSNKIYYDANSLPAQSSSSVSITGLYARKDFRLGGLNLNHRVLLQWSTSQEVVPVPMASAFLSYFYEFNVVKNVLRMQIGLDGRYNTKYYAFGYNPALSTVYNQREKEIGGYPMIDVFANAKWKRMRILLKMEHLNDDLFGRRNYFAMLHYPQNKRVFKIGISWGFYD